MMGDFHFLRPPWLFGIAAALILIWIARRQADPRWRLRGLIADHLLDHLLVSRGAKSWVRPVHMTALGMALAAVSAAGPAWQREQPPFLEDRAPLVIAFDLSQTMDAIDVSPTRLERAKLKARDLLALRAGARTAVVAYAGSAHMVLPLTDDNRLLQTYVDALATDVMPVPGRNTTRALERVQAVLAGEETPGTALFLTGGVEDAAFSALQAAAADGKLQPLVLGVGTAEGGPVRTGQQAFLTDASGTRVFARLDVAALQRLHDAAGVPVATVTADSSDVAWVQRRVQSHLQQRQTETNARWKDQGWWLVIPLAVMGALWFRRGWTMRWATAGTVVLWLSLPAPAAAQPVRFADLWLTPDQQGQVAFNRGDFATAADRFTDPMWKGIALYRAGRFADAVDAFARVDSPDSDYNQGNAFAKLGRFPEAVARYEAALARRQDFPEAKANLALVRTLIPPKKKDDQEEAPQQDPDQVKFDDKGKKGKRGRVEMAVPSTAELWMRNIQMTPTGLLRRRFAIEAQSPEPTREARPQ